MPLDVISKFAPARSYVDSPFRFVAASTFYVAMHNITLVAIMQSAKKLLCEALDHFDREIHLREESQ